jgi:hypothetical protein
MRFCWMCESMRPSEAFSGRRRRRGVCQHCARRPRAERELKHRLRALWAMLGAQSNISTTNIATAAGWVNDTNQEVAQLATLVVEIGRTHPRRRRRHGEIRRNHPELFRRMIAAGVAFEPRYDTDAGEPAGDLAVEGDNPLSDGPLEDDIPF